MKTLIVGGNFGESLEKRESGVIKKIYNELLGPGQEVDLINGGKLTDLPDKIDGYDFILWMPNIDNSEGKTYPQKDPGSVLVCSKVMRPGYSKADAISRIFKMHGNAVIEIWKYENSELIKFVLFDALGNQWYSGNSIVELVKELLKFYIFTKSAIRIKTTQIKEESEVTLGLCKLINLNKKLQEYIMTSCGDRFFGNLSTRCTKLFPSMRKDVETMYVSPRNVPKDSIRPEDMVLYTSNDEYLGDHKPSVDSPTQIRLYQKLPNINFMIHGHAILEKAQTTKNYRLCGDIREVSEVLEIVQPSNLWFVINLRNHGFLIGATDLEDLETIINNIKNGKYGEIKITNQK